MAAHHSTVAVVLAGSNDLAQQPAASASAADAGGLDPDHHHAKVVAADVIALWDACLAAGAAVVAVTIPREQVERWLPEPARTEVNSLLRARVGVLAAQQSVPVVLVDADTFLGPGADEALWCLDGLHLSPAGYDLLAVELAPAVLEAGALASAAASAGPIGLADLEVGEVEVVVPAGDPAAAAAAASAVEATLALIGCEPCAGTGYRGKMEGFLAAHRPELYDELVQLGRLKATPGAAALASAQATLASRCSSRRACSTG